MWSARECRREEDARERGGGREGGRRGGENRASVARESPE
jgi:hypothetical protein